MSKNQQQNYVFSSRVSREDPKIKIDQETSKKNYQIELNVSQANAINKILPKGYILNVQKEIKQKRQTNKKPSNLKSQKLIADDEHSVKLKKENINLKFDEEAEYANKSRVSHDYYENITEEMKPCFKILHMLRNQKASWPFREPVDPIRSGVPNYFEVIKEPMDLFTIEENLRNNVYTAPLQFHADVRKIIQNSYLFNRNNSQLHKITQQFEHYYLKVSADPTRVIPSSASTNDRKKRPKLTKKEIKQRIMNDNEPPTFAEKKSLALQLKKLPKEFLIRVGEIVFEERHPESQELNIESLPTKKIRELQRYVAEKNGFFQVKNKTPKNISYQHHDQESEEQSSFKSDSDS